MRASEPRDQGPVGARSGLWLLIGNSRWHWAAGSAASLRCWHTAAPSAPGSSAPGWPEGESPTAWAAVGRVPPAAVLDPGARVAIEHVPLAGLPPWLGVDRALVAWQAWQATSTPVLVADAGTALSLTRVDGAGRFAGGRILAGAALQWQALAAGTAQLPSLAPPGDREGGGEARGRAWPADTASAMREGVLAGLAAAVQQAWLEVRAEDPGCALRITGGDGPALAARLGRVCDPNLALQALAGLRPGPDR